jgi:hypothetical protein
VTSEAEFLPVLADAAIAMIEICPVRAPQCSAFLARARLWIVATYPVMLRGIVSLFTTPHMVAFACTSPS